MQELRFVQLPARKPSVVPGIDDTEPDLRLPDKILHCAVSMDDTRSGEVMNELELAPDAADVVDIEVRSVVKILLNSVRPDLLAELTMKEREVCKMMPWSELIGDSVLVQSRVTTEVLRKHVRIDEPPKGPSRPLIDSRPRAFCSLLLFRCHTNLCWKCRTDALRRPRR